MSKEQTVAVCFCGAAKTTSVGIPLVAAMWASQDETKRAFVQIPVLLYTMEQVFLAQGLVYIFKCYLKRNVHSDLDVESVRATTRVDELDGTNEQDQASTSRDATLRGGEGLEDVKL